MVETGPLIFITDFCKSKIVKNYQTHKNIKWHYLKSIILRFRFCYLGIKIMLDATNYNWSLVKYHNPDDFDKECVCTVGNCYKREGEKLYHLHDINTGNFYKYINEKDFYKFKCWKNIWRPIRQSYVFYMNCWYDIFMRQIPLKYCFIVDNSNWNECKKEI